MHQRSPAPIAVVSPGDPRNLQSVAHPNPFQHIFEQHLALAFDSQKCLAHRELEWQGRSTLCVLHAPTPNNTQCPGFKYLYHFRTSGIIHIHIEKRSSDTIPSGGIRCREAQRKN